MSVIGNPLVTTNYISDSFSGDASTVAFTLSQAPASAASIAVYISGLYQIPTSAYTISGTTLTFTGAPPTGTNNITVLHLGVKSATLVPVAGSVTPQMLSNANVVYWSASNNNVGIGNVTPTSLLTVTGTADLGNTTITGTLSATANVNIDAGTLFVDAVNNRVGINNATPAAALDVSGVIKSNSYSQYGSSMYYGIGSSLSGTYAATDLAVYNGANGNTVFLTNNTERMRIDLNGAVVVGNTAATTGYRVTIDNGSPTTGDYSPLVLKGGSSSENGGQLGFWNTYAGVTNPKKWIRVDNSGKLGVINNGYTAQIFSLDDSGNLTVAGTFGSSSRGITRGSMPAGSVIQTQYVASGTRVSTTYSGWNEPSTAYRVAITPTSTSSMILLRYFVPAQVNSASNILQLFRAFRIVGGGSKDYALTSRGSTNGNRHLIAGMMIRPSNGYDLNDALTWQVEVVDFPNTTSAVTYGFETNPEGGNTTYYGYTASDNGTWGFDADIVVVAQEIAQ